MKNFKKMTALGLAGLMVLGTALTGCGSSGGSSDGATGTSGGDTNFGFTLSMPDTTWTFDSWDDSPAVQEWLKDCGEDITIEWNEAPISADSDFYNTLLATGEYTDIMETSLMPMTVTKLYDEGIALDITDLVEENMPNYLAWLDEHPSYRSQIYKNIDGEERIIDIYALNETNEPWSGFLYRRDWIVEYGTNPETGEAFTGGYTDADKTEWEDDVVFPSGETYPKTISDWEWMFDIFEKALAANGLTSDSNACAVEMAYRGYYGGQGSLFTSFGGTFNGWYEDSEGNIKFGWTDDSEGAYAYVECLKTWYDNGWMDQSFDERSDDSIFFMINQEGVYGGKVGMWYGLIDSQLGNMMNTGDSTLLENICCMVAPQPINDTYGDASVQNVDPYDYFEAGSLLGGSIFFTEKAADKDIAAFLRAVDYTYSEEGAGLSTYGISEDQQAEAQYQPLIDAGLPDGTYSLTTNDEGETVWDIKSEAIESDQLATFSLNRLCFGLNPNAHADKHNSALRQDALEKACLYPGAGDIGYITDTLPAEQSDEQSNVNTATGTILEVEIPNFITGRTALNEDTWAAFQNELLEQGVDTITGYIQAAK